MTGQQFKFATVDAKAPDHDILAQMRVSCMNGRQTVSAEMGAPFTRGEIGAVWRFDEGPQDMEMLKVYGDPSSIPMIGRVGLLEFLGKKTQFPNSLFLTHKPNHLSNLAPRQSIFLGGGEGFGPCSINLTFQTLAFWDKKIKCP
jgi:hypothetical protein